MQDYLQFIAHQELREHGLNSQDKEGVFMSINWAAQLFTIFNKCFPDYHSQPTNILQYPVIPEYNWDSFAYLWSYFPELQERCDLRSFSLMEIFWKGGYEH